METTQPGAPAATCQGPDPAPRRPGFSVPAGAWDCHAHVFGPASAYRYASDRAYTPPDAPLSAYLAMLDAVGLDRGVLVQPSVYRSDNSCLLDALAAAGGRLRGVVEIDPRELDDATAESWSALGVCGVRMNMAVAGGLPLTEMEPIADRLAEIGWHLDLIVDRVERLEEIAARLAVLPVPLVLEQMGRVKGGQRTDTPGFQLLLGLLRNGNTWVKLSHGYHISFAGPPYADTTPFARAQAEVRVDRLVWGSDWPHPMLHGPMPNDGELLDLLSSWLPDPADLRAVLVDNPANLYGPAPMDRDRDEDGRRADD